MTTSIEPWTLSTYPSGNKAICGAVVRDASGQQIGFFTDYRNAERVMEALNSKWEEIPDLEAHIEALEADLEALK